MQIVLTLCLGGILFLVAHKMPALLILSEEPTVKPKKALIDIVKGLDIAKHKERFSMELLKSKKNLVQEEDKHTRKEEFDQEVDYWTKVKGE